MSLDVQQESQDLLEAQLVQLMNEVEIWIAKHENEGAGAQDENYVYIASRRPSGPGPGPEAMSTNLEVYPRQKFPEFRLFGKKEKPELLFRETSVRDQPDLTKFWIHLNSETVWPSAAIDPLELQRLNLVAQSVTAAIAKFHTDERVRDELRTLAVKKQEQQSRWKVNQVLENGLGAFEPGQE